MNREELDEKLEDWLDRAAAEYGRVEAQSGFETRVIANLNSRLKKSRWSFQWISLAASAVVLIGLFLLFLPRFRDHATTEIASNISGKIQQGFRQGSSPQSQPGTVVSEFSPNRNKTKRSMRKSKRTEQPGFLSGILTDQERYLLAFVQAISAKDAADTSHEFELSPLQIPELEKIQAFQFPEPEIPSIEIEALHIQTLNGSEEPL